MLWDAMVWLAIAKVAVLLFEDTAWAARGKQSPRLREQARRREAQDTAGDRPARGWGRVSQAAGEYVAGLVEDSAAAARSGRRRRQARKRGRKAVDGVLVTLDDDDARWYADCDLCGWSSRPYQLDTTARAAGADHARTHTDQEEDTPTPPGGRGDEPRHRLTVIPGGATTPGPTSTVVHDDHTYCLGCPTCRPSQWGWICGTCGAGQESFPTEADARAGRARHTCPEQTPDPDGAPPAGPDPAGGTTPTSDIHTKEQLVNLEATGPEEIRAALTAAVEVSNERAEELDGEAAVLTEAADRYESLEMAPSTVAHLREASDQFSAAAASMRDAAEELEAALSDFNTRDGHVAEAVEDAGGNVASREVLVG